MRTRGFAVLVALSSSCAPEPASLSETERTAIVDDVRAEVDAFVDAQRRRDVDALLDVMAPEFYMYADGTRLDRETVAEQIRTTMPALEGFETAWSNVEVTPLARDHALVTLTFRDTMTGPDGSQMTVRGPTSFVWRRRDGRWRLIYADADHYPEGQDAP